MYVIVSDLEMPFCESDFCQCNTYFYNSPLSWLPDFKSRLKELIVLLPIFFCLKQLYKYLFSAAKRFVLV